MSDVILHKDLIGADLHPPGPHTHVEADVTNLDKYTKEQTDALLAAAISEFSTSGGGATPDATSLIKGKLALAGDLGGTADLPTVPGLATKQDLLGFTAESIVNKDVDSSLTANSDTRYPSQKAIKSYIDTGLSTKEPVIAISTATKYWRGDKTFQTLDTSAVTENGNLYYTTGRFDTRFSAKSTGDLTEGSNLYYTDARVRLNRLDQMATPIASVSLNGQKLTNVLDPVSAQDAATKNYVDTTSASYTPVTKIVAPLSSGYRADYYTTGTSDDVAINNALSGGGTVMLFPGFTYTISNKLIMPSSTRLISYGATVVEATGSHCNMLIDSMHNRQLYGDGVIVPVDHISVEGGIWDMAQGANSRGNTGCTMILGGAHLTIKDIEFRTTGATIAGFAIFAGNTTDFVIENLFANNIYADLLDMNGPAIRGVIRNLYGTAGDDMVDLCPVGPVAGSNPGDITDVVVDTVIGTSCQVNAVKLLGGNNGSTLYNVDRIQIKNISGSFATRGNSAIWLGIDDTGIAVTHGNINNVIIDGVSVNFSDNTRNVVNIEGGSTSPVIQNLLINNVVLNSSFKSLVHVHGSNVANLTVTNVSGETGSQVVTALVQMEATTISAVTTPPTVGNLMLDNINITSTGGKTGALVRDDATSASLTNCFVSNTYFLGLNQLFLVNSNTNFYLSNIRVKTNDLLFLIQSGVSTIKGCSGLYAETTTSTLGSGHLESNSPEFPMDIDNAQVTASLGDMAYNTNAADAAGVGPVAYNGSAWQPIALPQSLYTTSSPTFAGLTLTTSLSVANGGTGAATLTGILKGNGTSAITGSATTTDLTEGSNLYYTQARFDTAFAAKSTTNLAEGSSLYYTDARVRLNRLDQMAAPTASVSMNSQKITNLLDPTGAQDAATKNYVDSVAQGLSPKPSAVVATAAGLPTYAYVSGVITATATGVLTIDGYTVALNDYILVKDETSTNAPYNGLYKCTIAGAVGVAFVLTRALEMDAATEFDGSFVFIESGTVNGSSGWVCATTGTVIVGTTNIGFTQFSGAGEITAGAGLTKTGNTINVIGTASRILVNADSIDIDSGYVGQSSITTLGTIGTGVWQGTAISHTYLTGIVQADVAGLTTGSSPVFAGLSLGTGNLSTVGNISVDGSANRDMTVAIAASGAGGNLTIKAGDSQTGISNSFGGLLILKTGIGTGNTSNSIQFHVSVAGSTGTTTQSLTELMRLAASANGRLWIGPSPFGVTTADGLNFGGEAARSVLMGRRTGSTNAGLSLTITSGGAASTGSNLASGDLILQPGPSTGTGASKVRIQTNATALSSGTGDNASIDRVIFTSPKSISNNSTTTALTLTLATDSAVAILVKYSAEIVDTTNHVAQVEVGEVTLTAVNLNGVVTVSTSNQTIFGNQQQLGGKTLVVTWTMTTAASPLVQININSNAASIVTGYPRYTLQIHNLTQQAITVS